MDNFELYILKKKGNTMNGEKNTDGRVSTSTRPTVFQLCASTVNWGRQLDAGRQQLDGRTGSSPFAADVLWMPTCSRGGTHSVDYATY